MRNIVFLCGAKDFHAMDKFRLTSKFLKPRQVMLLTDTVQGEGQMTLIEEDDVVHYLVVIDRFTFSSQSSFANIWRNIIKLVLLPLQVIQLKRFYKKYPDCIFHAVPMYYMLLCYLANVPFVGTPQGSEILVRPQKSSLYRKYAIKSLKAATYVIVDSINMQRKVKELSNVDALILKNGFSTLDAQKAANLSGNRKRVLSMRGLSPNYRIHKLLEARDTLTENVPFTFVYPAVEIDYRQKIVEYMKLEDEDFGRVGRDRLYTIFGETLLAISIPESDSSPRSVYECIFAGACVAVSYSPYIDELPKCMRDRIYLVNLDDTDWLGNALAFAKGVVKIPYIPTEEALNMCDENRTIKEVINKVY
jgi:hypothetical protein